VVTDYGTPGSGSFARVASAVAVAVALGSIGIAPAGSSTIDARRYDESSRVPVFATAFSAYGTSGGGGGGGSTVDPLNPQFDHVPQVVTDFAAYGTSGSSGGGTGAGISRGLVVNNTMEPLKQSTARNLMVFLVDSSDGKTGKTGLTLTITASKDGGAFASISPTVTERGSGWYNLALTAGHTDTLGDFACHITGSGADPCDFKLPVEVERTGLLGAGAIQAIWDALTSALTTVGSIGKLIVTNLDAAMSSRSTYAGGDTSGTTTLLSRLSAAIAAKFAKSTLGYLDVVVAAGSTVTTVVLNSSTGINGAAPSAVDDFYNGAVLFFITGALAGQRTSVSDYVAATKTLTVVALTSAPSAGDTAELG
jgi:hypothetical protein